MRRSSVAAQATVSPWSLKASFSTVRRSTVVEAHPASNTSSIRKMRVQPVPRRTPQANDSFNKKSTPVHLRDFTVGEQLARLAITQRREQVRTTGRVLAAIHAGNGHGSLTKPQVKRPVASNQPVITDEGRDCPT
ncbi:MAG: hypothetical protein ABIN08_09930 [Caldimonas sp.]